jgi:hypothetical protein
MTLHQARSAARIAHRENQASLESGESTDQAHSSAARQRRVGNRLLRAGVTPAEQQQRQREAQERDVLAEDAGADGNTEEDRGGGGGEGGGGRAGTKISQRAQQTVPTT